MQCSPKRRWLPLIYGFIFLPYYVSWGVSAIDGVSAPQKDVFAAAAITPTSCAQDPRNPPVSAISDLDQDVADWGVFCEGVPTWTMQQVITPSFDGNALRCGLTGGEAYANVHCYRDLRAEPDTTIFTYTLSFRFSPATTCNNQNTASRIQAIEFTASKWRINHNGMNLPFNGRMLGQVGHNGATGIRIGRLATSGCHYPHLLPLVWRGICGIPSPLWEIYEIATSIIKPSLLTHNAMRWILPLIPFQQMHLTT